MAKYHKLIKFLIEISFLLKVRKVSLWRFVLLLTPIALIAQTDSLSSQTNSDTSNIVFSTDSTIAQTDSLSDHTITIDSSGSGPKDIGTSSPRIALVLSGGGARGLAQIGVLKAFDEAGIKPDIIVANSMGAIIGSMYATGISPDNIDSILKSINWDAIFSNSAHRRNLPVSQKNEPINYLFELRFNTDLMPILPNSISHGQAIYDILSSIISAPLYHANSNFDSLDVPLRIVTTDILTGRSIVFSKGDLSEIVRASCGVPLAFSPVAVDSMLLIDGGLTANIPVEAAMKENPDYIIAVDVTSPMWGKGDLNNPIHLFDQVVAIGIDKQKKIQKKLADIIIKPQLDGFLNTDFSLPEVVIAKGYDAANKVIPHIQKDLAALRIELPPAILLSSQKLSQPIVFQKKIDFSEDDVDSLISKLNKNKDIPLSKDSLRSYLTSQLNAFDVPFARATIIQKNNSGTIVEINPGMTGDIIIEGNRKTSPRLIKTTSGLKKGSLLSQKKVKEAITSLYATNLFHNVNVVVDSLMAVHIKVIEKEYWRARLGLRIDEYHLVEGFIQPAYENLFGTALCASLHLQYGKMREKYALELATNRPWSRHWANNISFQSYISRERIITDSTYLDTTDTTNNTELIDYDEKTLRKLGLLARIGTEIGNIAMLDGSIRFEKFRITQSNKSAIEDPLGPTFKQGIRYLMLRLIIDDLDRFPFPQKGQKHYISIGGASDIIGGTESFVDLRGSLQYYFTFRKKHTCSPLIMFSWANKSLPPVEQVYIGGSMPEEKYRDVGVYYYIPFVGLKPRAISGDIMVLFQGLYRLAITKKFFLTTLVNWGYTWDEPDFEFDKKTAEHFIKNALAGVGIGLAFQTPVGPIKLSWGRIVYGSLEDFNISEKNVIYFSAGHDF